MEKKTKAALALRLQLFLCDMGQPSRQGCFSSWESFHPLSLNPVRTQIQGELTKAWSKAGQPPPPCLLVFLSMSILVGVSGEWWGGAEQGFRGGGGESDVPNKETHMVWH